jgi:7-carboxy-7-deazaguanine synthase
MVELVDCWNNSPKLANSLNPQTFRFQPKILTKLSSLENSWFKFVISGEEDWKEIESMFLTTGLIRRDQIVLMPMGATRVELESNRAMVVEMAVQQNVRFSTREHIVIWDKKTGV